MKALWTLPGPSQERTKGAESTPPECLAHSRYSKTTAEWRSKRVTSSEVWVLSHSQTSPAVAKCVILNLTSPQDWTSHL